MTVSSETGKLKSNGLLWRPAKVRKRQNLPGTWVQLLRLVGVHGGTREARGSSSLSRNLSVPSACCYSLPCSSSTSPAFSSSFDFSPCVKSDPLAAIASIPCFLFFLFHRLLEPLPGDLSRHSLAFWAVWNELAPVEGMDGNVEGS